jgi:hypothetical protein
MDFVKIMITSNSILSPFLGKNVIKMQENSPILNSATVSHIGTNHCLINSQTDVTELHAIIMQRIDVNFLCKL